MIDSRMATSPRGRSLVIVAAIVLMTLLLSRCGGNAPAPPPTSPAGSVATQLAPVASVAAPVETRVATALAPVSTQVATALAPVSTQIATVAAPVQTQVATALAPVSTQVATAFDPIVATVQAQEGGVRANQGACPNDHPIKGRTALLPPSRDYWLPGSAGYDQAMATICFATEADAQKALFRKAGA